MEWRRVEAMDDRRDRPWHYDWIEITKPQWHGIYRRNWFRLDKWARDFRGMLWRPAKDAKLVIDPKTGQWMGYGH